MSTIELLEYVKELFEDKQGYIETDDEALINVKIPSRYSELPEFDVIEGHQKITLDQMKGHFDDLNSGDMRIMEINGLTTSPDMFDCIYCDYCNTSIMRENKKIDFYYFCWDCRKDMCPLCYEETDAEKAKANGAKNYANRAEALKACHHQHDLKKRKTCTGLTFYCNICFSTITDPKRYSNYSELGTTDCNDICLKCAETAPGKALVAGNAYTPEPEQVLPDNSDNYVKPVPSGITIIHIKKKPSSYQAPKTPLTLCNNPRECSMDNAEFGSMLDWIPILSNDEYDQMYINLNPDSPYHQQIALQAMDDHGRMGFSVLRSKSKAKSKTVSLKQALDRINHYQNEADWKELDGWDKVYNLPIKRYMDEMGINIHFG